MRKTIAAWQGFPWRLKILSLVGGLLAMLLLAVLYIAFIGLSFNAAALRDDIAQKMSANLGRKVRFAGELRLEISAHPKLHIGGLHIANAEGFSGDEFAHLGEARLALNLWPLLRQRLQIEELAGSDVHVHLQSSKTGHNNWVFKPPQAKQDTLAAAAPVSAGKQLGRVLALLDIQRVSLEKLKVEFTGGNEKKHFFDLDTLIAHFPAGQPVVLTLNGFVEKKYPYRVDFRGGMLGELTRTDKPWPVDLTLDFLSTKFSLKGDIEGASGNLKFALGTNDLGEFERLLQTKLPPVGVTHLAGAIHYAPGQVALDNLQGAMGRTTLQGRLKVDYSGLHPAMQGELDLPTLDLRPFIMDKPLARPEAPPKSFAEVYRELSSASFDLQGLNNADADLTLTVGQWLSLPGKVHDSRLQIKLDHGRLAVPLSTTVADVKLSGGISVDAGAMPSRFNLALGTHDSDLGNLAGLLAGAPGVSGRLGKFDLRISAQGDRGAELMHSLNVSLNIEHGSLSYGNLAGSRPVQFFLEKFRVALLANRPLQGEIRGELLNKPLTAQLHGGALVEMMRQDNTPIDFELQAGGVQAQIHAMLQPPTENTGAEVSFQLSAPHSGDVSSWLGLKPGGDAPILLRGEAHTRSNAWQVSDLSLQLGKSKLNVDMLHNLVAGKPLLQLRLNADFIDVDELGSLLPEKSSRPVNAQTEVKTAGSVLDIPILPIGINLADTDIAVRLKHIASRSPFAVYNLKFDGRIRDGMMEVSPFSAEVAKAQFSGAVLLDLRSSEPRAAFWLEASDMNVGDALNKLGIAANVEADVDHLSLYIDLHSSHLGQLIAQSAIAVEFDGGHLILKDANTGGKLRVALDKGQLDAAVGKAVSLDLKGALDDVPVSIAIRTATAAELINPELPIPFQLNVDSSGASIQLSGDVDRPFAKKDVEMALEMHGSRFDNLNSLAHASLPPWGPWQASGKFHMNGNGYEISSLLLQIGSSQLTGGGQLDTRLSPPRLDVVLTSPTIQLDDFRFGDWSPEQGKPVAKADAQEDLNKKAAEASNKAQQLLSKEVLGRQDAYVSVRVDKVLSGKDELGNGRMDIKLKEGRADIGPLEVNTPGGAAALFLAYAPNDKDVAVKLRAQAKHFDYGILARRIDPKTEMSGIFSMDVDVNARAQFLSEILRYGNGHVDFAIWPENMKSGVLDIWAVNVLVALLPAIDASQASKVNCAIGRFALTEGKLNDRAILIDTSRMRVQGKGAADFGQQKLRLYVQPEAKKPQLMSFAIPIEVSGSFNDFNVGVRSTDVVEFIGEFVTSVIWMPIMRIFGKPIPADGHDVCAKVEFND